MLFAIITWQKFKQNI